MRTAAARRITPRWNASDKIIPRSDERGIFVSQNYIFSGAVTPMSAMPLASTERTVSASLSRAARTCSYSPLMRQAL